MTSSTSQRSGGAGLLEILTAIQGGVTAVNALAFSLSSGSSSASVTTISTATLPLSYVAQFNGRTGSVTPAQGDYPTALIPGTITNNNASAGNLGEYVESIVAIGAAVTITAAVSQNITSISLTAGDWDASGVGYIQPISSAAISYFEVDITQSSSTTPSVAGAFAQITPGSSLFIISASIPRVRQSLSATTTVYLTCNSNFTGTVKAYGAINARRVR